MKAIKKLPFIDKLFLWINCGLCLALLISYLAPVTDPKQFWLIAFFGLAYPPLLLTNVLMIVYWLFRRPLFGLLSVLVILCGINVLKNNIGFHIGNNNNISPDGNNIRLMTYNVHNFKKYSSTKDISTKHEILEIISANNPDIIGIQEFYTRNRGEYDMADSVKKIMGASNYYFAELHGNADEHMGMAIFSRLAIVGKGFIQLSDEKNNDNQCVFIDIKKNGHPFRIYSVHLQSIQFGPKDYRYLDTISKSGKPDITSTMRLGGKLKRAFLKRSEQVAKIREHAQQCPYPYIISGDFNDTPSSYAVNQMAKGLKNAFREKGFGLGRTYNGDFPNYQIDYIMVAPQFDVASYTITEKKLSDHYPVCADLILK